MTRQSSPPPHDAVIQVRDLVSHYGLRMILKGLELDVYRGEIMVIMGGSGSGKSTLLRHMLALETLTSGSIRILDLDIATARHSDVFVDSARNHSKSAAC